jgi:serine beta-lactamase-like protein LACTB
VSKSRIQIVIAVVVMGAGLVFAAVVGLWTYIRATATPIHPSALEVPAVTRTATSPKWAAAVERARQIARAGVVEQNLPGMSVAVGVGGEAVWAEGFGWADVGKRAAVTPETRFRVGSASIVLTSAAVGLLLDGGRLKLDDEIQTYVPEYPDKQWPVTVRELMGHVAGVRPDAGDEEPVDVHCARTLDGLQRFADRPLLFEPRTKFRFSSYDGILVSAAIEAAAGEPFLTFMRTRIFAPLHMEATTADSAAGPIADGAVYYFPRFAADPRYGPQDPEPVDYSCFAGGGAFLTTPSDLLRFAMAMSNGTLLRPSTVQLLQAPQRLASGEETRYGLGWSLESAMLSGRQARVVGHDGAMRGGRVASLLTFPDQGIVVAVLSNTSYADTFALGVRIAEAFAVAPKSALRDSHVADEHPVGR